MARTREFWCYQKRNVSQPWAINAIVTADRSKGMPYTYRFDILVHAEWIPGSHSDSSLWNRTFRTGEEFTYAVLSIMLKYGKTLEEPDETQLYNFWLNIISDM